MKRSELRKLLEEWFDVERYEAIKELTLQQFYVEVERRILAYKMLLKRDTLPPLNRLLLDDYRYKILRGEIFFSGDTSTQGHGLARTYAVVPVTRSNAQLYAKSLTLIGTHPETSQRSQSEYMSEYLKESGIKSLSSMMDLIFWGADNNDTKISLSLMSSLLHENSEKDRDEGMLKVTDYPLAMALLTDENYLKSFEDYMMENNVLKDTKIVDHVKDEKKKEDK